jgi:hypothetical protein
MVGYTAHGCRCQLAVVVVVLVVLATVIVELVVVWIPFVAIYNSFEV